MQKPAIDLVQTAFLKKKEKTYGRSLEVTSSPNFQLIFALRVTTAHELKWKIHVVFILINVTTGAQTSTQSLCFYLLSPP